MPPPPKIRIALARNLARLMEATPALDTQVKVAKASGLAQSTVGRILRGSVAATIDNIGAIAAAFRVPARDLIHEGKPVADTGNLLNFYHLLPEPERRKIDTFAAWLVAEQGKSPALNFEEEKQAAPHHRDALEQAASRESRGIESNERQPIVKRKRGRPRKLAF